MQETDESIQLYKKINQEKHAVGVYNLHFLSKFLFHAALQNTPDYPCNKSKYMRKILLSLFLVERRAIALKYGKAISL